MTNRADGIDECMTAADGLLKQKQSAETAERQWQITFDAIPDPIALIDTGHRIIRINRAMAGLLNFPAEEIVGRHCYELVHGTSEPPPFCPHTRMLESGNMEHAEIVEERLGGVFEITTTPFADSEGKIAGSIHIARDITAHRHAANALEEALAEQRILLDNIHTQVWYLVDEKTYGAVNRAHADFVGAAPEDIAFKPMHDIFPDDVVDVSLRSNAAVFSMGEPLLTEEWIPDSQGERRLLSIHRAPKLRVDGTVEYVVCSAEDITLRHQANNEREAALATMRAITDSANDAVIMVNPEGDISFWNPAAERMFGYESAAILGKNPHMLLAPENYRREYEAAFPHFQNTGQGNAIGRTVELKALKKDGRQIFIELSLSALQRPDGWHAVGIVRDITERKRTEAKLSLMATTDDLTGIWNRRYFMNAMAREIERVRRHGHVFSVLMLDIDHFKAINDRYGHASGDAVLKHLVSVVKEILRQTDITGRLGGEEFGMLLPETHLDGAVQLAERVRSTIEKSPAHHGGRDICYTVSIGVAAYQKGAADSVDTMLLKADNALYAAKEAGRNRVVEA